jgi:CubicO group peptidase (beta-lactamase class C family)
MFSRWWKSNRRPSSDVNHCIGHEKADEVKERLDRLSTTAAKICHISGTVGASVGIIHFGNVIHTANFGFRDRDTEKTPDENTIYDLASLSKSFTATAAALLVRQKHINWTTPVARVIDGLQQQIPEVRDKATLIDYLSHRTGLAPRNHIWSQEYARMSLDRNQTIRIISDLEQIAPLGTKWQYSNWGYALCAWLIQVVSGKTWAQFLEDHIFRPLAMRRTFTKPVTNDLNVANAYMCLQNKDAKQLPWPDGGDGKILEGAIGIRSCINDLLAYYGAFVSAAASGSREASLSSAVFVDPSIMLSEHVRLSSDTTGPDGSYGLGWALAKLPCTLGAIGLNHDFIGKRPIVGKGMKSTRTCYYHQGCANTFLSSVHVLLDTKTVIVVLSNSMSLNDTPGWLGELYLETLLDNSDKNDYVALANASVKASLQLWPAMAADLEKERKPGTTPRGLQDYYGRYVNRLRNYEIEIFEADGQLRLRFQKQVCVTYPLVHYHYDTFSWLLTHDGNVGVGRFPITRASYYLVKFLESPDHVKLIDRLVWVHDDQYLTGDVFTIVGHEAQRKSVTNM